MKAILISIRPKWVAKILNGEKTIEIRKTMPKCDLPIDVYIYCTKDKDNLYRNFKGEFHILKEYRKECLWNGYVVAKFTLNKVEEIYFENHKSIYCDDPLYPETDSLSYDELLDKSCTKALPYGETEIGNYIGEKGYAWHISNLVIFDKLKELGKFYSIVKEKVKTDCPLNCGKYLCFDNYNCKYYIEDDGWGGQLACSCPTKEVDTKKRLTKSPQSFQFIEVGE